jgi:HEAT repeat protein
MSRSIVNSSLVITLLLSVGAPLPGQSETPATQRQEGELIAVLKSDASHKEKADACRELALVGSGEAVPALAALLGDEKLSHMARYALEPIPDTSVDEALRDALGKQEGRILVGVISSLGVRRDAGAVQPLAGLLQDPDAKVARAAARSLGKIGGTEVAKLLAKTLTEAPTTTRAAVADACLSCAEALLTQGQAAEALALYESVAKADLPKHFRVAAAHGALRARRADGKR